MELRKISQSYRVTVMTLFLKNWFAPLGVEQSQEWYEQTQAQFQYLVHYLKLSLKLRRTMIYKHKGSSLLTNVRQTTLRQSIWNTHPHQQNNPLTNKLVTLLIKLKWKVFSSRGISLSQRDEVNWTSWLYIGGVPIL